LFCPIPEVFPEKLFETYLNASGQRLPAKKVCNHVGPEFCALLEGHGNVQNILWASASAIARCLLKERAEFLGNDILTRRNLQEIRTLYVDPFGRAYGFIEAYFDWDIGQGGLRISNPMSISEIVRECVTNR
jgi:hypothetical protein